MAERSGRRIVVTGLSTPLGRRVAERLVAHDEVETVVGIDRRSVSDRPPAVRVEVFDWNFRSLSELLADNRIDTVIHTSMSPGRSGSARLPGRANVIGTMHLSAAASARRSPVRTVVAASTSEVYPSASHSSLLHHEGEALHPVPDSVAAAAVEAEGYLRDLQADDRRRRVSVLRLGDLADGGTTSPLTALLQLPLVPTVAGFDPQIQLLHGDDAAAALEHACLTGLSGTFNIAAEGSVSWSQAARLVGRRRVVTPPFAAGRLEPLLARLRLPYGPAALVDVLRYGRCIATDAIRATGFRTTHSTADCLRLLGSS